MRRPRLAAALGAALIAGAAAPAVASAHGAGHHPPARHVLLISVDGLHASDLAWWIGHRPHSALARLAAHGVDYANARTPFPSDSFPGTVALTTGGNPRSTGVLYDDSYNRALLPPGTTSCSGATPGTEVNYSEASDEDPTALDAGQGVAGLPDGILGMTGDPTTLLNPAALPVDPATCAPVPPHAYLRVNTVFEVARAAGLRTAWSDKHPAYELLDGPSGAGIQDLFTPEINSDAPTAGSGQDWTGDNLLTRRYDGYKVRAVLNEIDGRDHSGTEVTGTPAILGMNFQSVSTAQKLPSSDGMPGGYLAGGVTPGPLLQGALGFVDGSVGAMLDELRDRGLDRSTEVIVTAKHGQSPQDPSALTRIDDGAIIDALNAAWRDAHPGAGDLVAFAIDDDGVLMWLNDRSDAATGFATRFLLGYSGTGNDIDGQPKPFTASGLASVRAGADAAALLGMRVDDPRTPDLIGIAQHGVVYTGKKGKIAEHGGDDPQDRHVALVVSEPGHDPGRTVRAPVETTQVAPTILRFLGLDPGALRAVRIEHTRSLPGS